MAGPKDRPPSLLPYLPTGPARNIHTGSLTRRGSTVSGTRARPSSDHQ